MFKKHFFPVFLLLSSFLLGYSLVKVNLQMENLNLSSMDKISQGTITDEIKF